MSQPNPDAQPLDPQLLEILGNPNHPDRPPLRQEGGYLICTVTGDGYPILNGIPHLLPENVIPASEMDKLRNSDGKH